VAAGVCLTDDRGLCTVWSYSRGGGDTPWVRVSWVSAGFCPPLAFLSTCERLSAAGSWSFSGKRGLRAPWRAQPLLAGAEPLEAVHLLGSCQ
jgi:hypothetical protein